MRKLKVTVIVTMEKYVCLQNGGQEVRLCTHWWNSSCQVMLEWLSGASKHSHFLCDTAVLYQILNYVNVVFTKVWSIVSHFLEYNISLACDLIWIGLQFAIIPQNCCSPLTPLLNVWKVRKVQSTPRKKILTLPLQVHKQFLGDSKNSSLLCP